MKGRYPDRNMNLQPFAILVIFILASACATPVPFPKDNSLQRQLIVPFRIDAIEVKDVRPDTSFIAWDLPVFAVRQEEWIAYPPFNGDFKKEIIEMITKSSNADGLPAKLVVTINDGYYKIEGNTNSVSERSYFECSMVFKLEQSNTQLIVSGDDSYIITGVFNAKQKHASEIYRITARNCVYKILRKAEEILDQYKE
jgi:hypothetical protein